MCKNDHSGAAKFFREYLAVAQPGVDDPDYSRVRIDLERISAGSDDASRKEPEKP